jgi:AcrR family transcriptional regulator
MAAKPSKSLPARVEHAVKRPRGRPRRFDDRRVEVLRTAARIFSDLGFRQATLEDVSRALGMTRPALYHYAKSKDTLLLECGLIARRRLLEALATALGQSDGATQIATFFREYCAIVMDDFGRCFVLTDLIEMEPVSREATRDTQIALGQAVASMLRLGITDGTIRQCDVTEVSRTIFAAFNGVARRWPAHSEEAPAQIADKILDIFFIGLTPRKSTAMAGAGRAAAKPSTRSRAR